MSRSFKKHVVIKDPSNTAGKKLSRRTFRAMEKQALHQVRKYPEEEIIFPEKNFHAYEPWDVCDWVWRLSLQDAIIRDIEWDIWYEQMGWTTKRGRSSVEYYHRARRK